MASSSPEGKVCGTCAGCGVTIKGLDMEVGICQPGVHSLSPLIVSGTFSVFLFFFVFAVTLPELGVGCLQEHSGHLGRHAFFEASY